MERKDLIVKAKELGYTKAHTMKTIDLENIINSIKEKKSFIGIKTGRKPNPESNRQKRLLELQSKIEAGITIQRGRPCLDTSQRQIRLKDLETRRLNGELRRGRPKKQSEDINLIEMLKNIEVK